MLTPQHEYHLCYKAQRAFHLAGFSKMSAEEQGYFVEAMFLISIDHMRRLTSDDMALTYAVDMIFQPLVLS